MLELGRGWKYPVGLQPLDNPLNPPFLRGNGLKTAQGEEHLRQSILLILMTPKGSRVMRPWFGSNLYMHIDAPINRKLIARMMYEIYEALKEETRGSVKKILVENPEPHRLVFTIVFLVENRIEIAVRLSYDRDMMRWQEGLSE